MKIIVLDKCSLGTDTPLEGLNAYGDVTIYDKTDESEIVSRASDADIIVLNKVKITDEVISSLDGLKLICVFATGYDNIDIDSARRNGIAVCNVPAYSTDSVALFTIATALSLFTHLREYNSYVVSGEYSASGSPNKLDPVYREINGKTWGVIGLGNIGKAVAKVAESLGARVIAYKRNPVDGYECMDLEALAACSDIITIHCPLNDDSRGMINMDLIRKMKKDVVIVNEARGAVVNEFDIAESIKQRMIGAFGSDVYSIEPFSTDHPFYEIKDYCNVLFTPHAAWGAIDARVRCINVICDNISSYISGGRLNRVD